MAKSSRVVNAKFSRDLPPIETLNFPQERLYNSIHNDSCVIAYGSAGTGKTWLCATTATDLWVNGYFNKILVVRPTVPTGEDLGALPGDLEEKYDPWVDVVLKPIRDRLNPLPGKYEAARRRENIDAKPLYLLRGSTFDDTIVILDEAQNATVDQIKMLCTRMGQNSKLLISGDTKQSDLTKDGGGLSWLIGALNNFAPEVEMVEFHIQDCVRGDLCKKFLEVFEKAE